MDGLEEPGWPNLHTPGVPSPGETFLNAFQAVSNVNARKQALEQQIATLQANMAMHQQSHDLEMQKFGWEQKFQTAELNRQANAQQTDAVYKDRMASVAEDRNKLEYSQKDANEQEASKYQDALSALVEQYPDTYQNQEFMNGLALVNHQYATIGGTKEGKRVADVFNRQIDAAQKQAHWTANGIQKAFQTSVAGQYQGGQGFTAADYNRPTDAFVTKGDKMMIHEAPIMVPGTTTVGQWTTVPPGDPRLSLPQDQQNNLGIRTRSIPVSTYKSTKALHDQMLKIGASADLNQMPAGGVTVPSPTDIQWLKAHPQHASYFDAKFGAGAAAQFADQ